MFLGEKKQMLPDNERGSSSAALQMKCCSAASCSANQLHTLAIVHYLAGVLHVMSFIAILITAVECNVVDQQLKFYRPEQVWDSYLMTLVPRFDVEGGGVTIYETMYSVPVESSSAPALPPVLVLSALAAVSCFASGRFALTEHFAWDGKRRNTPYYEHTYNKGSMMRWAEYAVTAPVMILLIAYYVGVNEPMLLACLFLMTLMSMMVGPAMTYLEWLRSEDRLGKDNKEKSNTWCITFNKLSLGLLSFGWVLTVVVWTVIWYTYIEVATVSSPPWFVTVIVSVECFCFVSFGLVQTCWFYGLSKNLSGGANLKKMAWIEWWYPILSFTSKNILVWLLYANTVANRC
jgi:hypothetical protein